MTDESWCAVLVMIGLVTGLLLPVLALYYLLCALGDIGNAIARGTS